MAKRSGLGPGGIIGLLVAIAVLSSLSALPKLKTQTVRVPTTAAGVTVEGSPGSRPGTTVLGTKDLPNGGVGFTKPGQECAAGRNGGSTDTGVTGTSIKLGATVVDSGIGASFLSDVRYGMTSVINAVNASGGICGRRLDLVLKDDGWDPARGSQFLQNLIEGENVFALAVVPSSEGLRVISRSGYLRNKNVPVVGTDGMLISQYTDPVIWPVAASTITALHVMAKDAASRGRKNFAIVYDANYHFGVEGAYAFNAAVKRLTGKDIPGYSNPLTSTPACAGRFCGVKAGQPSYQTELQTFKNACGKDPKCDYVAYLLEPATAQVWMQGGGLQAGFYPGASSPIEIGGPQPLFNRSFGVNCSRSCHNMKVWTGFTPPVEPFTSSKPVSDYVNALRATNSQADPNNSFVEGGYVGMKFFVEALKRVGPNVTRTSLIAALDSSRFDLGLSKPLVWSAGAHFSNQCVRAFSIQAKPSFAGWRSEGDWLCDPWPGLDIPPSDQQ